MSEAEVVSRRRGGRTGRRELRAAPIPEDKRAVHPGMTGGRYLPLTEAEVKRIHEAALEVLEQIGLCDAIPSCIEMVTTAGGRLTEEGRLVFPRALVEDTLANCARHFPIYGQDPKHDFVPEGKKVHFGTAGAAVHMVDALTGAYRESTT
ncbi:MAG: trimethylamine methyltransferase family protein, partial [Rhodospirillales bacterium]|nr:trimethylamine methyltransferase family protein [Rhodospirillales bacterium]